MLMRFALLFVLFFLSTPAWAVTDAQIRQAMIKQSILSYPGNCPCPYSTDRGGRACGKRSAYSKPGGYTPFCYPSDIPDDVIKATREADPRLNAKTEKPK